MLKKYESGIMDQTKALVTGLHRAMDVRITANEKRMDQADERIQVLEKRVHAMQKTFDHDVGEVRRALDAESTRARPIDTSYTRAPDPRVLKFNLPSGVPEAEIEAALTRLWDHILRREHWKL
eukprot:9433802-Karenia_brevis.AAC.1